MIHLYLGAICQLVKHKYTSPQCHCIYYITYITRNAGRERICVYLCERAIVYMCVSLSLSLSLTHTHTHTHTLTAVTSTAHYLTDKDKLAMLYKINKNAYIKSEK